MLWEAAVKLQELQSFISNSFSIAINSLNYFIQFSEPQISKRSRRVSRWWL